MVASGVTPTIQATLWGSGEWANDTDWTGPGTIITGTVNLWADPGFVDPANGDYHLLPTSAAIDAGVDAGVTVDMDGDPRPYGAGYDIGADEYFVPVPGVAFAPDRAAQAQPGEIVTFTHTLTNTGEVTDTFALTLSGGWATLLTATPLTLPVGATAAVQVQVAVPTDVLSGTVGTTVITATSQRDPAVSAAVADVVTVYTVPVIPPQAGVAFAPDRAAQAQPGAIVTFTHTLTNTGEVTDTFALTLSGGWATLLTTTPLTLPAGATAPVQVQVAVPTDALSGTVGTTVITATSQRDPAVFAAVVDVVTVYTVPVIPPQAGVAFAPDRAAQAQPGEIVTFTHTLTNTGEVTDTFALTLSGGWATLLTTTPLTLPAGATAPVQVQVAVPTDVLSGTVGTTVITATSQRDPAVFAAVVDVVTVYTVPVSPKFTIFLPLVLRQ